MKKKKEIELIPCSCEAGDKVLFLLESENSMLGKSCYRVQCSNCEKNKRLDGSGFCDTPEEAKEAWNKMRREETGLPDEEAIKQAAEIMNRPPLNKRTLDRINELVAQLYNVNIVLERIYVLFCKQILKVSEVEPALLKYRNDIKSELKKLGYEEE